MFDFLEEMGQELEFGPDVAALCPKIYHCYSEGETYSCFVLQDLVASGFYMTPNSVEDGLSLVECNLVMKSLARLHALSLGEIRVLTMGDFPSSIVFVIEMSCNKYNVYFESCHF